MTTTLTATLRESFERAIVGTLDRLPPAAQRLLAGGRPVRIDGQELDPGVQLFLALARLSGRRGLDRMSPAEARAEIAHSTRTVAGTPPAMARVENRTLAGRIPARLYVPEHAVRPMALVVYYHGGGWVVGDLDTHDPVCRLLAHGARAAVLAVDYRRAPEHRFPAAVDDALAAFRAAVRDADALGVDPAHIGVAGDSAGGTLAAVVSQLATRDGGPRPAVQLLVYPVTDLSTKHPSYRLFADGFFLTEAEMDWYRGHYLPDNAAALDPRASPLRAGDLRGLPPAIVLSAGFDVLRDEGEAYAQRLTDVGVSVRVRRHAGLIHGFASATGISRTAHTAMREAAGWLGEALATRP